MKGYCFSCGSNNDQTPWLVSIFALANWRFPIECFTGCSTQIWRFFQFNFCFYQFLPIPLYYFSALLKSWKMAVLLNKWWLPAYLTAAATKIIISVGCVTHYHGVNNSGETGRLVLSASGRMGFVSYWNIKTFLRIHFYLFSSFYFIKISRKE